MTFSFVVNGLVTFNAGRLTLRHAGLFLASTGAVMWVLQPVVILALLTLADSWAEDPESPAVLLVVKLASIGVSLAANFLAYRYVVWPLAGTPSQRRA